MLRAVLVIAVVGAATAEARVASADPAGARALANSLVAKAASAFDEKRFAEAGSLYLQAFAIAKENALGSKPALLYNAGLSYEQAGECDRAADLLEQYAALEEPSAQPPDLSKRLEAARRCAPEILFETTPAGAQVAVDGRTRGTTPLKLRVPRGARSVSLTLAGYAPFNDKLVVEEGRPQTVAWTLKPAPSSPEAVAVTPSVATSPAQGEPPMWPWLAGGVAGAAAITGAVFAVVAVNQTRSARVAEARASAGAETREDVLAKQEDATRSAVVGNVAFATAGVAAAATVLLLLLDGSDPVEAAPPPGAGAGLTLHF